MVRVHIAGDQGLGTAPLHEFCSEDQDLGLPTLGTSLRNLKNHPAHKRFWYPVAEAASLLTGNSCPDVRSITGEA